MQIQISGFEISYIQLSKQPFIGSIRRELNKASRDTSSFIVLEVDKSLI
jgi:hypothetical protein